MDNRPNSDPTLAALVNSLVNNNKIGSYLETTLKNHTRFTFKISQSSDRHPRLLSRKKLRNQLVKELLQVSVQLYNQLKIQLYTDCNQWRILSWDHTSRSWPESNKPRETSQTPTSVYTGTTNSINNREDSELTHYEHREAVNTDCDITHDHNSLTTDDYYY